jgi:hypothetical protein
MTQKPVEIPALTDTITEFETIGDHNFGVSVANFYGSCPDRCCITNLRSRLIPVGNLRVSGMYVQELYETYHGVLGYTLHSYVVGETSPRKSKSFEAFTVGVAQSKWELAFTEVSDVTI